MTNFQYYLFRALPFGFMSAVLILIRKPAVPDTGWYAWLILCPIAVIVFGCLGMRWIDPWLEKGRKRAFDKILEERKIAKQKMQSPPDDQDGPEAA